MASADDDLEREFTLKILPLLKARCYGCHGDDSDDIKGDFDVRSRAALIRGGESEEPSIIPGDHEASLFYQAVAWDGLEMPPKENDRLTDAEVELIGRWIKGGAPWPGQEKQGSILAAARLVESNEEGMIIKTSGGLGDEWTYRRYEPAEVWAFRPLEEVEIPAGEHPVDFLIGKKLRSAKVEAAPRADALTLIRRASWDLTGLPPTPAEVQAFQESYQVDSERAWRELVDRLIDSQRYGERWAQHWLDVARYADTAGFSNDYERSNAWRYRDYVIRAFNEDKPYDQFVVEQLAGDELADQSLRKRLASEAAYQRARRQGDYNETESELLIASSFLRMGPWDPAMVKAPEARQLFVDDVINSVGQTFLSTTMRCFKCHDHKFDPLPTRDYYRFYAIFSATQPAERPAPFTNVEGRDGFDKEKELVERLLRFATDKLGGLEEKTKTAAKKWYAERGLEFLSENKRKKVADENKPPRHVGLNEIEKGKMKVRQQDKWIWERRLERFEPMVQSVFNGKDALRSNSRKLRMPKQEATDWRPDSHILSGGSLAAPGDRVTPGVLSALNVPTEHVGGEPFSVTDDLDGRRTQLANWIADKKNHLTARSIVNRVWQYHFGKALAGNPNNFGVKGENPTHPELLDWLASDFIENGWKFKRLHRLVMSSATYQQASRHPQHDDLLIQDSRNDLFAYFPNRRLSAEELRDGMLRITGELNLQMGGLPIRPEINMEVALQPRMIQFSLAPTYEPSPNPEERNRRSIYAYRVRGLADPFLETFNQPNPNDSCEMRDAASVSPQAFTLFNSDTVTDRSIAFALRLQREEKGVKEQVRRGFELALGRSPDVPELKRMTAYVAKMQQYHHEHEPPERIYPTEIDQSLVEEFSGQLFSYTEILPVFENYIADKHAADVSPETRGLADFCILLFNSNEFVYVY